MKILFMRHGESTDDIDSQYGGWADFELTDSGARQVEEKIASIKELNEKFVVVLCTPLKRAKATGEIMAKGLELITEMFEYAKERNTYGVLSGMKKEAAKESYPDQVDKLDKGEYVDGSERYEDLTVRVKKAVSLLEKSGRETVVVITHGNFLKCLFSEAMGKRLTKKEDAGWVLAELENNQLSPIVGNGIEWE